MGEMSFKLRDLYPNMGYEETSTMSAPEVDDQDALNEDVKAAEETSATEASTRNIFIALGMICALVIFLGGVK